jgi:hypothetical protein
MPKLYKKIVQSIDKPVKVASFSFTIPEQKPVVTKKGINLYIIAPLTK